ncbi:phage portal protein [Aquimarina sp. 2201CG14-23]|uniref:phage portal protein n=1 Tax=Aquimarina mycalae TaxID=3040073 RepID=UPI002477F115|nr:phage portal protein [Aquimarina sp. 2201CG14-23]MDH7444669.1 phage portal protein [Aquimarina sp. 2201CG14-23]
MSLVLRALQSPFHSFSRSATNGDNKDLTGGIFSMFANLSKSGQVVNYQTALSLSAVYNAVDQISNDIAKLPKGVFEKVGKNRFRKPEHPVDYLISKRPNAMMTQFSFHKALMVSALLRGNGIAVIKRNSYTGFQESFDFIEPDNLNDIRKKDGKLYYDIKGYRNLLSSEDVIHIPGFSFNGVYGISVFKYATQNLGAALSSETFADENFKSKGLLAGIIKSDKALKPNPKTMIADAMEHRLSKGGTHNIGVLDEGMDFMPITANAQEASLIDWKKISTTDVARWFNIAPHKIKHLENATYSNIEQQSLEHGSDTIAPWAKRVEEEYDYKLFTEEERINHYVKINTNALIRTDIKTKGEYYGRSINYGWHTRNEIRNLEDYNSLDGLDEPLTPANTLTLEQIEKQFKDEN